MIIYKITNFVDYNQLLKRLDTQPNDPTNQNSLKFKKLLSQRIKKRYLKLWGLVSKKAQYPRPVLVEPHNFFVGNFGMLTLVRKKIF